MVNTKGHYTFTAQQIKKPCTLMIQGFSLDSWVSYLTTSFRVMVFFPSVT